MTDNTIKLRNKWIDRIAHEKKKHQIFRDRAKIAYDVFEREDQFSNQFSSLSKEKPYNPIFASVVDVQLGALTSKTPQAKISKRFNYETPPNQPQSELCEKIEKAVNYYIDKYNMQEEVYYSSRDYIVAGLGGMRVYYDYTATEIEDEEAINATGFAIQKVNYEVEYEDGTKGLKEGYKRIDEVIKAERYEYHNFGWQPCKRWDECDWIYFRSSPTRSDFRQKYGIYPDKIEDKDDNNKDSCVIVYEIWDKINKERIIISEGHSKVLAKDKDPLEIENFYPIAKPMFFNVSRKELEPSPEFHKWSYLHDILINIAKREEDVVKKIRAQDYYDETIFPEMAEAERRGDGASIPCNMQKMSINGQIPNINNFITAKDNTPSVQVLAMLEQRSEKIENKIYQTTGIADIMQAASDPRETFGAQNIKHSWGNARLANKRFCIANHNKSTIEIMVNVMIKKFEVESINKAAGENLTGLEMKELHLTEEYRIDVETLSTLSVDKASDKESAIEAVTAVTNLFAQSAQVPQPLQLALLENMTKTLVDGRELESTISNLKQHFDQLGQMQSQVQQLNQQLQQTQQQNQQMAHELNQTNEAKIAKDMADVRKKDAETEKIRIETAATAGQNIVPPDAFIDEAAAMNPALRQ